MSIVVFFKDGDIGIKLFQIPQAVVGGLKMLFWNEKL